MTSSPNQTSAAMPDIQSIVGSPKELTHEMLPTRKEVLQLRRFVGNELHATLNGKVTYSSEVNKIVYDRLAHLWNLVGIPTISYRTVYDKLEKLKNDYLILNHYDAQGRGGGPETAYGMKLRIFEKEIATLFDISACKCDLESVCKVCKSIPMTTRQFLNDQRSTRGMKISSVNRPQYYESSGSEPSSQRSIGDEFVPPQIIPASSRQLRLKLNNVAEACDRHNVSDRVASHIVSATLIDCQVVEADSSNLIDRSKIRRCRSSTRKETLSNKDSKPIVALFFDGKKNKALTRESMTATKSRNVTQTEEHIILLNEPESQYLGYFTPTDGSAQTIAAGILNFVESNGLSITELCAIGCDGAPVNTGRGAGGGVIQILENRLNKPLQWLVCLLHCNELPLRALFLEIDGGTNGPIGYTGPIGKMLPNSEKNPVVKFKKIPNNLPEGDYKNLTGDQDYLLKMVQAIAQGEVSEDLAKIHPGNISHARWLTLANNVLRLYVSERKPSSNLVTLAKFITKVYAPVWFGIKKNPTITHGSINFFNLIKYSREFSKKVKKIIDPVISRNAYYAHPENVLVAMLADETEMENAERIIEKVKEAPQQGKKIRKFQLPRIDFRAEKYSRMIDFEVENVTLPPVLLNENYPSIPAHSQAVERHIKVVTDSCQVIEKNRAGVIENKIKNRAEMPKLDTKKDLRSLKSK